MKRPSELISPRKIVYFLAISIDMTAQLEKDFGNAAYATIRSFVLKFEKLGLLQSARYGNRVKYAVRMS